MNTGPRHVVLVGLMGAGKTTIGRLVAAQLDWRLTDSDEEISRTQGETVRQLRERLGTAAIHRLEADHLLDVLREAAPSVVCAAASVVDVPRCRARLRRSDVLAVWLDGEPRTLAQRFATGNHRPEYDPDIIALLKRQSRERSRRFRALRALHVWIEGRTPEEMAQEIVSVLRRR